MNQRAIQLRQERDFGQKINATFQFIGQNFKDLLMKLLYTTVPLGLVSGIFQALFQADLQRTMKEVAEQARELGSNNPSEILGTYLAMMSQLFTSPYAALAIVSGILASLALVCTVYGYMVVYEDTTESPISIESIYAQIKKNIVPIFVATFCCSLLTAIGFVLLIIPGIYLAVVFSLVSIIVVREDKGLGAALSRSFYLIRDKWWSTFGLLIVMGFCLIVVSSAVGIPLGIVQLFEGVEALQTGRASLLYITVSAIAQGFTSLLSAMIYIAVAFQYYNLVEKKEGYSLMKKIDSIGTNTTQNNTEEGEY